MPFPQGWQLDEPETLKLPAEHTTHALLDTWPVNGFALPAQHSTVRVVEGQYEPAGHRVVQTEALPRLYVPGSHELQATDASDPLYSPAPHSTQAERSNEDISLFALPAQHEIGPAEVDGQYDPLGHVVQLVDALPKLYVPGPHNEQLCAPVELLYSPAGHTLQLEAPAEL